MLTGLYTHLQNYLQQFSQEDELLLDHHSYKFDQKNFTPLTPTSSTTTFIDGGEAQIINAGNFSISFIRVAAITFNGTQKSSQRIEEFYLFTNAKTVEGKVWYTATIFSDKEPLINAQDLMVSSHDPQLTSSSQRAPIEKITSMARRFAELSLATSIKEGIVVLDGTKDKTYPNEEKYLQQLSSNVCALAKTSTLFTKQGNNITMFLQEHGPQNCWFYSTPQTNFVKLHPKSTHVFRFEGTILQANSLLSLSSDPIFLGYPYGLIVADKLARVSNNEAASIRNRLSLNKDYKDLLQHTNATNAHSILDTIG
ncbi:hypothetical protein HYV86_02390 [Candidatus Woesearchaeota archaeon]|nr:hypothetical protein [Candidatus Woesearchaeota archaeon]